MRIGFILKQWRWAEKISVREAAKVIGLSASTLCRIENGEEMDGRTLGAILRFLLQPATAR